MDFKLEVENFSLKQTLLSGQCFRFEQLGSGSFFVFAENNYAEVWQAGNFLFFRNSSCCEEFWRVYFDLDFNYANLLSGFIGDLTLELVANFCGGIRILRQDPFETLICFLLSSCNNISRIKKIVSVLCENFGTKMSFGYAFPTLNQLRGCDLAGLSVLRAGFRSAYVLDAVRLICSGNLNLKDLNCLSVDDARRQLMNVKGVGEKIADCVLLFAYHRFEVFPTDVWIKRVVQQYYSFGLSKQVLSCPGFAQQLLYYSKRNGII